MSPDWWEQAMEMAAENHDPAEHDGREWDQLTVEEQEFGIADALDAIAGTID
jgi:PAB1-binding protein PBP1